VAALKAVAPLGSNMQGSIIHLEIVHPVQRKLGVLAIENVSSKLLHVSFPLYELQDQQGQKDSSRIRDNIGAMSQALLPFTNGFVPIEYRKRFLNLILEQS